MPRRFYKSLILPEKVLRRPSFWNDGTGRHNMMHHLHLLSDFYKLGCFCDILSTVSDHFRCFWWAVLFVNLLGFLDDRQEIDLNEIKWNWKPCRGNDWSIGDRIKKAILMNFTNLQGSTRDLPLLSKIAGLNHQIYWKRTPPPEICHRTSDESCFRKVHFYFE